MCGPRYHEEVLLFPAMKPDDQAGQQQAAAGVAVPAAVAAVGKLSI